MSLASDSDKSKQYKYMTIMDFNLYCESDWKELKSAIESLKTEDFNSVDNYSTYLQSRLNS